MDGRFAPSPSGPLHLGNLRTAVVAWLFARSAGSRFLVRMEDLTTGAAPVQARAQLEDLAALGLDWDGEVVWQSERRPLYDAAIARLESEGRTYPCFCTRREVREAAAAPHGPHPEGVYPGTCRELSTAARAEREAAGRRPALRLRADGAEVTVVDRLRGPITAVVDDLVLRRADGLPAYNLAVVVDDAEQGVEEVVRGDDLLETTPRQVLLARLLGVSVPAYAHVPLVLGPDGERLAKRHGAVGLADLRAAGVTPSMALGLMAESLGLAAPGDPVTASILVDRFAPERVPSAPWVWDPPPL